MCLVVSVSTENVTENSTFRNLCTFGCMKIREVREGSASKLKSFH